ncbi:MAG: hypothetical protein WAW80_03710 [Candidatus Saccharimonadales bacterium]
MKKIVALPAHPPRSNAYRNIAWVYAAILTVMAVGQLFSFEKFIPLITNYSLPGGHGTGVLAASLIVIFEVLALPYLLRMPLSPLMRWVSLLCGFLVAVLWIGLAITVLTHASWVHNSGMLGLKIVVPAGVVSLFVSLVLMALAIISVVGLYPSLKNIRES